MCGIVGAIAERNVSAILLEGLKRLEYRGYDSAGMAVYSQQQQLQRVRRTGKVAELAQALHTEPLNGQIGIAHTRWPLTVSPAKPMPTRISPAQTSLLYTTASLKTIKNCAASCKLRVMFSLHKLTPKPSSTCCIICKKLIMLYSMLCALPSLNYTVPMAWH